MGNPEPGRNASIAPAPAHATPPPGVRCFITGQDPVTAWDEWVMSWRNEGGDEVTDLINATYEAMSA